MKVFICGGNGQLGSEIYHHFKKQKIQTVSLDHEALEITDKRSVSLLFQSAGPGDLIINTAAMHHLPGCEENPLKAFKVNALGVRNLARGAEEKGCLLIHISTDYVFDGTKGKPYLEYDAPRPLNVYGTSKLAGEYLLRSVMNRYYILRVSGIYGRYPCRAKGNNFVQMMLRLARERDEVRVVDDEILTPTHTVDIARQLHHMVTRGATYGLYHVSARESCSWYRFCREIFKLRGIETPLYRAGPGEFAGGVRRPKYSVLQNQRLIDQGLDIMPHWKDGLKEYLDGLS